jgi:hypothetical protein
VACQSQGRGRFSQGDGERFAFDMSKIKNTKEYWVHHNKGAFRVYVSEHADGTFHGTIFHYERIPASGSQPTTLDFDHKNFSGSSAEDVRKQCFDWIDTNLGTAYRVEE